MMKLVTWEKIANYIKTANFSYRQLDDEPMLCLPPRQLMQFSSQPIHSKCTNSPRSHPRYQGKECDLVMVLIKSICLTLQKMQPLTSSTTIIQWNPRKDNLKFNIIKKKQKGKKSLVLSRYLNNHQFEIMGRKSENFLNDDRVRQCSLLLFVESQSNNNRIEQFNDLCILFLVRK